MRAIQIRRFGGPEVLEPVELPAPEPAGGQLLVQVSGAGVNYADTHQTEDSYLSPVRLPHLPGSEVAGRLPDGRRVVAVTGSGGYAELAAVSAGLAVEVPDQITDGAALALLVQGLTAWHLLRNSARLSPGESVVVNAAAGGVGSLAVQLAKVYGAGRVIATASTRRKRELAVSLGADAAVSGDADGYPERIRAANDGQPVDIVLDAVGGPVFDAAFDSLAGFGRLVTFGAAGRQPASPIPPARLLKSNRTVAGFWLAPLIGKPGWYREPLRELFELTASGRLHPVVGGEYPLAEARRAHEDLLARRTTGKLVLRP